MLDNLYVLVFQYSEIVDVELVLLFGCSIPLINLTIATIVKIVTGIYSDMLGTAAIIQHHIGIIAVVVILVLVLDSSACVSTRAVMDGLVYLFVTVAMVIGHGYTVLE
jgi:hypothetical protein